MSFYKTAKTRLLKSMEALSFDPKDIRGTLQRTISLRAFNRAALGIYPPANEVNRVEAQIGQSPPDLFSMYSFNAQIIRMMREYHLTERYGLSLNDCLSMRADTWNRFIKTLEQPYLKKSQSSFEVVVTVLQRLELMFSTFIAPKTKPGPEKPQLRKE